MTEFSKEIASPLASLRFRYEKPTRDNSRNAVNRTRENNTNVKVELVPVVLAKYSKVVVVVSLVVLVVGRSISIISISSIIISWGLMQAATATTAGSQQQQN